ncbi:hypothetical protein [Nocardia sp. NPDC052566]|uniref:hypothetical protein n=1 Tax=Nocardia sp. NPDC052566 TaxID=3364330 RepID=UPI0037C85C61
MATGVGLRIAEDTCTAAIVTESGEPRYIVRESILHMSDDGDTELGGPAPSGNTHSVTGFVSKVGDPTGIPVDDGEAYRAEDMVATALFCLINLTAEYLSGPAEFYATHPADWPPEYVRSLREALDYLGLRSVVLVSEGDLPGTGDGDPTTAYAYDAARSALATVLSTPAGTTPPDPSSAENAMEATDVIPAVSDDGHPQAYSAAIPVAGGVGPAPTMVEPLTPAAPATPRSRTSLLLAAAALIGLALGAFGVAVVLRSGSETPVPPLRDAKSEQVSVTPSAPPPPIVPPAPPTTAPPTTTPEPTTTTPEPTTTEPTTTPPPTTPPPTVTSPSTTPSPTAPTRPSRPTQTPTNPNDFFPIPAIPLPPGLETPGQR